MSSITLGFEPNQSTQVLIDQLLDEIGCQFRVLQATASASDSSTVGWEYTGGEPLDTELCAFANLLPSVACAEPLFLQPTENQHELGWLAIPLTFKSQRLLAITSEPVEPSEDKLRLARLFIEKLRLEQRVAEQDKEADQFAVQISRDFEELMFLQRMIESLDIASADTQLPEVTTSILERLQPAIEAKTLLFLSSRDTGVDIEQRSICVGEPIDLGWTERLLDGHDYSEGPLVRNRIQDEQCPALEQFVAAEIRNRSQRFGWLIAVNRATGLICSLDGTQSEAEFGTYEASLLSSAAYVMGTYAHNRALLNRKENLLLDVVRCLVSAIDAKDDYTRGHSIRVALFARCLAEQLGWSAERCEDLYMAGLLHDVGKIGVPDEILKKPGPLDADEKALIRKHPDHGWAILHQLEELHHVLPVVVHHHEEFAGTGYPDQLARQNIPLEARVIAVADAYDAIVSDRAYRKGRSHVQAIEILKSGSGTQWDPDVIEALESVKDKIAQLANDYCHTPPPVRNPAN